MICKIMRGSPLLHEAVEKTVKNAKKRCANSEEQGLPLKKVHCLYFWGFYATVGTTSCFLKG